MCKSSIRLAGNIPKMCVIRVGVRFNFHQNKFAGGHKKKYTFINTFSLANAGASVLLRPAAYCRSRATLPAPPWACAHAVATSQRTALRCNMQLSQPSTVALTYAPVNQAPRRNMRLGQALWHCSRYASYGCGASNVMPCR